MVDYCNLSTYFIAQYMYSVLLRICNIGTMNFSDLLPETFKEEVIRWAKEDCPATDIGGFVVGSGLSQAHLYCKANTILAGVPFANEVFKYYDLSYVWTRKEGEYIDIRSDEDSKNNRVVVCVITGICRNILLAERTSLNILSRASGVASAANRAVKIKEKHKWHGYVSGTRKTTPGFKNVEKYALVVGGAATHRLDLSQMVMLKDNHIASAGCITEAVHKARVAAGFSIKIEVPAVYDKRMLEVFSTLMS